MLEDDYTEEEYIQLLLATYRDQYLGDPQFTRELIEADIAVFALAEKYEVCARLKKILDILE
jgi:hypothetical protein